MANASTGSIQRLPTYIETSLQDPITDIGVDGSFNRVPVYHPMFEADMHGAMRVVPEIGPVGERRIRIDLTTGGVGVGAALMAQAALNIKNLRTETLYADHGNMCRVTRV